MTNTNINLTLNIWRQESTDAIGDFEQFKVSVSPDASILEMLDELNNKLEKEGKIPIAGKVFVVPAGLLLTGIHMDHFRK